MINRLRQLWALRTPQRRRWHRQGRSWRWDCLTCGRWFDDFSDNPAATCSAHR